jgi:hypothetical protein
VNTPLTVYCSGILIQIENFSKGSFKVKRASSISYWVIAGIVIVPCVVILLPFAWSSACDSSPMTQGLGWLHAIRLSQEEVRKGILGTAKSEAKPGYWRKDIRGLEFTLVNGKPVGLLGNRIADSDVGDGSLNVERPIQEISLRTLKFIGEPPLDPNRYAVVMWVDEWGRMGSWTFVASQDGVWGKEGRMTMDNFPVDLAGEGWLPESEVKSIRKWSRRLGRWLNFWRFQWI